MAEKQVDPVDRVMDSVDAFGSKIDELANKVVALVGKMGPEAQAVFDETLSAYSLKGLGGLIILMTATVLGMGLGVWAFKYLSDDSEKEKVDRLSEDGGMWIFFIGLVSLIIGLIGLVALMFNGTDLFVQWMHPLGSLILEKL